MIAVSSLMRYLFAMKKSQFAHRRFNRREIKWALRSDMVEVAEFLVNLSPGDIIRLTQAMFDELRFTGFLDYMIRCKDAIDCVEEHADDRREMLQEILSVIDRMERAAILTREKKFNLALATYISLARTMTMANQLLDLGPVGGAGSPARL